MSDAPLETAVDAPETTPSPAPASKPPVDVDALVKAAREEARREAQASKDRELAQVHKTYQQRERALRDQAVSRLKGAGDTSAEAWDQQVETLTKAQQFDAIQQQASEWQAWNGYVAQIAQAYRLDPADKRLQGATDAQDLQARASKAMQDDVAVERKTLLTQAQAAKTAAVDAKVAAGELDTLGGAPAPNLSHQQQVEQAQKDLKAELKRPGRHDMGKIDKLKAIVRAG